MHEDKGEVADDRAWLGEALHDLCQPLTALDCGLSLGALSLNGDRLPAAEELMQTVQEALRQCRRVTEGLRAIQDRMNREEW